MTIMEALGGNSGETIMEALGGNKGETIVEVIEESGLEPVEKFVIEYDANGGEGTIPAVSVFSGKSITVNDGASLTPPEDKEFAGWGLTDAATEAVTSPFTPEDDITLYAIWDDVTPVLTYTVTYNANGGTGTIEPVEVIAGESITVDDGSGLTPPEHETPEFSYTFAGWAKTDSAQSATVVSPFTPDKDTILYAVWTEVSPMS